MDLLEVIEGNFGYVYWFEKTSYQMTEDEIQRLRQKGISDTLNATLLNHMHEPGKAIQDMQTVVKRGWDEANKQRQTVENGTEMKRELFLVGDPTNQKRIKEIETSPDFRSWANSYLIEELKRNA